MIRKLLLCLSLVGPLSDAQLAQFSGARFRGSNAARTNLKSRTEATADSRLTAPPTPGGQSTTARWSAPTRKVSTDSAVLAASAERRAARRSSTAPAATTASPSPINTKGATESEDTHHHGFEPYYLEKYDKKFTVTCNDGDTKVELTDFTKAISESSFNDPPTETQDDDLQEKNLPLDIHDATFCLPPYGEMSPEFSSDVNAYNITIHVEALVDGEPPSCGDPQAPRLRMMEPYYSVWNAKWNKISHDADFICEKKECNNDNVCLFSFRSVNNDWKLVAPERTGLYNLRFLLVKNTDSSPLGNRVLRFNLEVTCNLYRDHDFCQGPKVYASRTCQRTPAPCGIHYYGCNPNPDVAEEDGGCSKQRRDQLLEDTDLGCAVFPCDPETRRCSRFPASVYQKPIISTGVNISALEAVGGQKFDQARCPMCDFPLCKPSCAGKKCGDDGCGGFCGKFEGGVCPEVSGEAYSCQNGQCAPSVINTSPGTCSTPYKIYDVETLGSVDNKVDGLHYVEAYTSKVRDYGDDYTQRYLVPVEDQAAYFTETNFPDLETIPYDRDSLIKIRYTNVDKPDEVDPTECSSSVGIPDVVYTFKAPVPPGKSVGDPLDIGVEVYMVAANGDPLANDLLLALHGGDGFDDTEEVRLQNCRQIINQDITNPPSGQANFDICVDDSSPPGGVSSRLFVPLVAAGKRYYIIATAYGPGTVGEYQLWVKTLAGRPPVCDERFCGDDGDAPGTAASPGFVCNPSAPCFTEESEGVFSSNAKCPNGICFDCSGDAEPDCKGRNCGPPANAACLVDKNYECGQCNPFENKACDVRYGRCRSDALCDALVPECNSDINFGKKGAFYCSNECKWVKVDELVFDLITPMEHEIVDSIYFQRRNFGAGSCAFQESCVLNSGNRLLIRQTTSIHNQGLVGFKPGKVETKVRDFTYAFCHQHYHFLAFANFNYLVTREDDHSYERYGYILAPGGKLSYCMEDTRAYMWGRDIGCDGVATCDDMGIQGGWSDEYNAGLDCQWNDIGEITKNVTLDAEVAKGLLKAEGDYPDDLNADFWEITLKPMGLLNQWVVNNVCTNFERRLPEVEYKNDCTQVWVFLPYIPSIVESANYKSFFCKGTKDEYSNNPLYRDPCELLPDGATSIFCTDREVPDTIAYRIRYAADCTAPDVRVHWPVLTDLE